MKAIELQLGNLVWAENQNCKILSTDSCYVAVHCLESHIDAGFLPIELIEPLPVNEENLIKLGFKYIAHHDYPGWVSPEYAEGQRIRIWKNEIGSYYFTLNECSDIEIYAVHFLQNLFNCLSGFERELTFGTSFGDTPENWLTEATTRGPEQSPAGLLGKENME